MPIIAGRRRPGEQRAGQPGSNARSRCLVRGELESLQFPPRQLCGHQCPHWKAADDARRPGVRIDRYRHPAGLGFRRRCGAFPPGAGGRPMRILVTCPPMLGMIDEFIPVAAARGFELVPAKVTQVLSQDELVELLPQYRSEEHTSELQSLMRISYAVFCLKKKKTSCSL